MLKIQINHQWVLISFLAVKMFRSYNTRVGVFYTACDITILEFGHSCCSCKGVSCLKIFGICWCSDFTAHNGSRNYEKLLMSYELAGRHFYECPDMGNVQCMGQVFAPPQNLSVLVLSSGEQVANVTVYSELHWDCYLSCIQYWTAIKTEEIVFTSWFRSNLNLYPGVRE